MMKSENGADRLLQTPSQSLWKTTVPVGFGTVSFSTRTRGQTAPCSIRKVTSGNSICRGKLRAESRASALSGKKAAQANQSSNFGATRPGRETQRNTEQLGLTPTQTGRDTTSTSKATPLRSRTHLTDLDRQTSANPLETLQRLLW